MSKLVVILFSFILCGFFSLSEAANYYFTGQNVVFFNKNQNSHLYLIKNNAHFPILLNRYIKFPATSAGWASQINPNHWSAIVISRKNFIMTCQHWYGKSLPIKISCKNVIIISEPCMNKKNKGDYWLVENKDLNILRKTIIAKGWINCVLLTPVLIY